MVNLLKCDMAFRVSCLQEVIEERGRHESQLNDVAQRILVLKRSRKELQQRSEKMRKVQ